MKTPQIHSEKKLKAYIAHGGICLTPWPLSGAKCLFKSPLPLLITESQIRGGCFFLLCSFICRSSSFPPSFPHTRGIRVAEAQTCPFGAPLLLGNRHKVFMTTVRSLTGTQRRDMGSRSGKGSGASKLSAGPWSG